MPTRSRTSFGRRAATLLAAGALATGALGAAAVPAHAADAAPAHDLAVSYQVSALKAPGFAGSVAIHLKNVGSDRYYAEYPLTSSVVKVKTVSGPQGVDRVITPQSFHGAHVRDLGFDAATSTRSFAVTLANPVEKGEDQLVASLSFNDGLTREGRLVQHLVTTQTGRLADDQGGPNDTDVDSRQHTVRDFGRRLPGTF
ncbi:hypothetical protein [Arsenicicoccus sp. oral taxon 190]|uniref:hypothetical protein n=1 Tax=Arsenicicoccus sp. oral taxon 190 TaxID=1658671 RepID=UPI00067A17C0|nr:hypothetical protein [Arsenicicoccus sp. oral taxon 190]AKT51354.1 hypothetical protein ADJ73_08515 [Arsenicicoccus sp. oral taxon 190]